MGKEETKQISSNALKELAEQKEKEWKQVQELRANSLEVTVKHLEQELAVEKSKFQKLKEDFKYNLKLLTERDAELERYDIMFTELKSSLSSKESELSDAKIKIDELKISVSREVKSREEMQAHYQQRIREKQAELEDYKSVKDTEIHTERESLESVKRNLERQLRELEDELEIQRRELTTGFDEALRKREHEFRKHADEMSSTVLAHEMKVKLLSKELELVRMENVTATQSCEKVNNDSRELEKQLKQKHWQLEDLRAIKDAEIKELQMTVTNTENTMKRLQEEFQRKHSEVDRYAKEKESALLKVKEASAESQRHLEAEIRELQTRLEQQEIDLRNLEWQKQDLQREKDQTMEKLQDEISDLKSRWETQKSQLNKDNVSRDIELENLREAETRLKAELAQRKQDIDRYKRDLQHSIEREASLERSKAQAELDWQKRCEGLERDQYDKSEELVKHLTQARDEAQATLKEKLRELQHKSDLLLVMTEDRDRAIATLKQHGLMANTHIDLSEFEDLPKSGKEQIEKLQTQNENLRQVIHQMREEMESLGGEMGTHRSSKHIETPHKEATHSVATEYVKNLETELKEMKIKCRQLENKLSDLEEVSVGQGEVLAAAGDNVLIKSHVQQLNNTIGTLRSEKVELTAHLRKQQARIQYLENMLDNLAKEPREKQVQIEHLQYDIAAQTRRHQAEQATARQRISELEIQITESRKEADEYMKANIECNNEITALSHQLSAVKMELAEGRPAINFGAQELLIQQLQDEIEQLRNLVKGQMPSFDSVSSTGGSNATLAQLHNKLRMAAKQISQLAKDKQQLIEMGNRLRARLKENGLRPPSPPARPTHTDPVVTQLPDNHQSGPKSSLPPGELQEKILSKLNQLETLQYELTKQELAYKQKYSPTRPYIPAINVDSSQEVEEDNDLPKSILKKSVEFDKLCPVPENKVPVSRPKTAPFTHQRLSSPTRQQPLSSRSDRLQIKPGSWEGSRGDLRVSLSSVGGESLQEIWKMLDEEATPRTMLSSTEGPFTGLNFPGDKAVAERPLSANTKPSFSLQGKPSSLVPKPSLEPRSSKLTPRAAGKPTNTTQKTKTKVRNYNIKDEKS